VADDFTQCMVSNSRMAARAITRRYDAYLRGTGVTSTQLSLMGAMRMLPDATVSHIAEALGFDRTTLTRNLDRLEGMGLVASRPAERGNGRIASVTDKGLGLFNELLPLWRKAQADMKADLGAEGFASSLKALRRLGGV
jgi:DNA-binding MarR family transcriptional regulator